MHRALAVVACLALVAACTSAASPSVQPSASSGPPSASPQASVADIELAIADLPRVAGTPDDARAAASAINAFGLDVYGRVAAPGQNVVMSPASIAIALAMARAGARGPTADQMDLVLHELGTEDHAAWLSALDQALAGRSGTFPSGDGTMLPVTLRIANAPFAQRDLTLEKPFVDALGARFGAGLRLVDYKADPDAVRILINEWVAEQTEQRIPALLSPGVIDTLTRLVLVNAIYLKAPWREPFAEAATGPAPFTLADGSAVEVPTMAGKRVRPYADGDGWRAVELAYVGGSLAMTVIVPDDLAAFEARLNAALIEEIVAGLAPVSVDLTLPTFDLETKVDLPDVLAAMGMPDAFDPDLADFRGITTEERLFIAAVVHQANIDVDEKGTEAAAATAVVMAGTSGPPREVSLRVDRPFLFALRDTDTGAILFLGRVADPR